MRFLTACCFLHPVNKSSVENSSIFFSRFNRLFTNYLHTYMCIACIIMYIHDSKYFIKFTLILELAVTIWCPLCPAPAAHNCGRQELEPHLIATASSSTYLMIFLINPSFPYTFTYYTTHSLLYSQIYTHITSIILQLQS